MEAALADMEAQLRQLLQDVKRLLGGGSSITYVPLHKETHVLELPQVISPKAWLHLCRNSCNCHCSCLVERAVCPCFRGSCLHLQVV